jgi:hypothetical protein
MDSSDPPPWLVPFDEVGFRSKWLKCQYDADELQNLILTYFDIWIKDLRPESEWAGYEAALKKAFNFGQSKVPEYKAKGCDDAVRCSKKRTARRSISNEMISSLYYIFATPEMEEILCHKLRTCHVTRCMVSLCMNCIGITYTLPSTASTILYKDLNVARQSVLSTRLVLEWSLPDNAIQVVEQLGLQRLYTLSRDMLLRKLLRFLDDCQPVWRGLSSVME